MKLRKVATNYYVNALQGTSFIHKVNGKYEFMKPLIVNGEFKQVITIGDKDYLVPFPAMPETVINSLYQQTGVHQPITNDDYYFTERDVSKWKHSNLDGMYSPKDTPVKFYYRQDDCDKDKWFSYDLDFTQFNEDDFEYYLAVKDWRSVWY